MKNRYFKKKEKFPWTSPPLPPKSTAEGTSNQKQFQCTTFYNLLPHHYYLAPT